MFLLSEVPLYPNICSRSREKPMAGISEGDRERARARARESGKTTQEERARERARESAREKDRNQREAAGFFRLDDVNDKTEL